MKKAKSLISLSPSMLNCLFFVARILYMIRKYKKILKDTFIASSSVYLLIPVAMVNNQPNGWIEPLLSRGHSLKNKRIR